MNFLLEDNCPIRSQDYRTMIRSLTSTPIGINVTIDFLRNNINNKIWNDDETKMLIYSTLASSVATMNEINKVQYIQYIYIYNT